MLRTAVNHAWLGFQNARYADVIRVLPGLLLDAQRVRAADPEGARLLAEAYLVGSAVLRKLGVDDLAWLAADRALAVGQGGDDGLLTGVAAVQLGYALLAQGQARHALEISVAVADRVAGVDPLTGPADRLCVQGALLVVAARGAATLGHVDSVGELLDQSGVAAQIVGDTRSWQPSPAAHRPPAPPSCTSPKPWPWCSEPGGTRQGPPCRAAGRRTETLVRRPCR